MITIDRNEPVKRTTTTPNIRKPSEGFLGRMCFLALFLLTAISSARVAVVAVAGGQWLAAASFGVFTGVAVFVAAALLWVQFELPVPRLGAARRMNEGGVLRRAAGWVFGWRVVVVISSMASGACLASFGAGGGQVLAAASVAWLMIGYVSLLIHDFGQMIRRMPVAMPRDGGVA